MGTDYRKSLNQFLSQYRATPHPATGHSPAEVLFNGRRFNTKLPVLPSPRRTKYHAEISRRDSDSKRKNKSQYDTQFRTKSSGIKVNDLVLCKQR